MAQYKIIRLNKMTSGTHRGLIDMDIQLCSHAEVDLTFLKGTELEGISGLSSDEAGIMTETGQLDYDITDYICDFMDEEKNPLAEEDDMNYIVLNENQTQPALSSLTADLTSNPPDAIRVINEHQLSNDDLIQKAYEYNLCAQTMHVVYEFEKDATANQTAVLDGLSSILLPLNDILDLCIKSRFKKMYTNSNVPRDLNKLHTLSKNVDQWLVLDQYPVDFCQCGNDAFMMTQLMDTQPWRLKTDVEDRLDAAYDTYAWKLQNDPIYTSLYPSPQELGCSSYKEFLENAKDYSSAVAQLFVQQRKIYGVEYNYIVALDQTSRASENETIYENGDIFGYFTTAKNMYNALYTVDMPSKDVLKSCRQYCGIQRSRGRVLLKYYDNMDYEITGSRADVSSSKSLVPFQKVEFFQPDKMSSMARHKSNLFSVKMKNTGLDEGAQLSNEEDDETAAKLRKDIVNGIKAIVDNVVPANTQLFEAQFI